MKDGVKQGMAPEVHKRPGAALILEGGGMRGVFTAGVLDEWMARGLWLGPIYGVSAGAIHACSYIARQPGRALRVALDYLDDPRYCSLRSLLKTGDLFGAQFCYRDIPEKLDPMDYEAALAYPWPCWAVATDCRTGKAAYFDVRDARRRIDAVRASASLPLLSRMVPVDGGLYLDGGVADSIPLARSMADGNRKNVVVLTRPDGYRKGPNRMMPLIRARYARWPALARAMARRHLAYNHALDLAARQQAAGTAFLLRPQTLCGIGRIEKDPSKLKALYTEGRRRAAASWEALQAFLEE